VANRPYRAHHQPGDQSAAEPKNEKGTISSDRSPYEFNQLATIWWMQCRAFESAHISLSKPANEPDINVHNANFDIYFAKTIQSDRIMIRPS
jgi:hypothetical protein